MSLAAVGKGWSGCDGDIKAAHRGGVFFRITGDCRVYPYMVSGSCDVIWREPFYGRSI